MVKKTKSKREKSKKETKSLKIVNVGGEAEPSDEVSKIATSAPIKTLDAKYGHQLSSRRSKTYLLAEIDKIASRAESSIESMLFSYETHQKEEDSSGT